ncbi:MAG: Bor family protein [Gemmatimonadota bacterium]
MRKRLAFAVLGFVVLSTAGCYHAIIETGRPPAPETVEILWANSFVYGIVPPPLTDVSTQCPNGVSRVETQHSFLNGLVAGITFGIYTPMQINVTCAQGGGVGSAAISFEELAARLTGTVAAPDR